MTAPQGGGGNILPDSLAYSGGGARSGSSADAAPTSPDSSEVLMSTSSTPTPRREGERPALAQRWPPPKEHLLLFAALTVALAIGGRINITATGDVTVIQRFSLLPAL